MRTSRWLVAALLITSTLGLACGGEPSGLVGRRLDFKLPTLAGSELGPGDFAGKVVLVEMWATWCGPCRLQAQTLEELADELEARNATVISVNVGESRGLVEGHLAANPSRWQVLLDSAEEVSRDLGVVALPTLLVLDSSGVVRAVEVGTRSGRVILSLVDDARG